ncbi:MAG: SPOR domain-containing protein [Gammaproteobacteria bacterium]
MAHDFAKTRNKRRAEATPPPPPPPSKGMLLTGLLTGLALGFFASFLIYLSGILPPVGEMQAQTPQEREAEALAAQQRRNEELEQAAARLQLEFYKELPNYEVIVDNMPASRSEPAPAASTPAPATTTTTTSPAATPPANVQAGDGSFMIQAGAFAQESSALAQSERLNTLGLSARIKKEALLGKTLFLVQAGPYPSREQANQAERILRSNGIDSIRIGLSQ